MNALRTKSLQHYLLVALAFLPTTLSSQTETGLITIDQFGYRPTATKTAVIKKPVLGSDKGTTFTPGSTYRVVNADTKLAVLEGSPVVFKGGATDVASGDKIWWFDFSALQEPGKYYVLDVERNVCSYTFAIANDVYNPILKAAVKMFFYQRAGCLKTALHAGTGWADGASHVGALQDKNCRLYNKKNDASTERDLHGGWYDAGDYNKYSAWTANYVEEMLLAYMETPDVWADDYNIPESGNGIADILDEAKWGMDWLLRMQEANGSVLSVVGLADASPPSAATGQSLYGPANTIATITSVKAFALGAVVYRNIGLTTYANQLQEAAIKAWQWAEANPNVFFHNNSSTNNSLGLGAGDQESEDTHTRLENRVLAGLYMYELTGEESYLAVFEDNYKQFPMFLWSNFVDQYRSRQHQMFLRYINAPYAKATIIADIRTALITSFNKSADYCGALGTDGYRAFIKEYNWGSNQYKSTYGVTFSTLASVNLEPAKSSAYLTASEDYLHYIHGVNPFGMVYLTNMSSYGASKSLTEIYHTWFSHFSTSWDKVGTSAYGPAPGYLAGGPNSSYTIDACCPGSCGSTANNSLCSSESVPKGEPAAKMYKDFNTSWPLNSWEITEPSGGYQVAYIRLLSRFAAAITPTGIEEGSTTEKNRTNYVFPNPVKRGELLTINLTTYYPTLSISMFALSGEQLYNNKTAGSSVTIETSDLQPGTYIITVEAPGKSIREKVRVY
ncbi:T9SS C-terminal target domain-containing protein [Bacteroides sp. 214]|uniref:glycoside hydrolase family 9 protein n=1 Tax=Bacteroides sp. 214 TaxID=2302935 RepID=UPI0013D0BDC9|nr:glycoside hydrolase family 9 protein [Bacteroides sp. 214]NDW12496.1 T9SS C-terminal target domain-containing protein [Bacteroides sp. 214]